MSVSEASRVEAKLASAIYAIEDCLGRLDDEKLNAYIETILFLGQKAIEIAATEADKEKRTR